MPAGAPWHNGAVSGMDDHTLVHWALATINLYMLASS